MQTDLVVLGRRLRNVGEDMWASEVVAHLAHVVVRRVNGLYQADFGKGTAAWFGTPEEAVEAAERDDKRQPLRSRQQEIAMTRAEAAE